MRRRAVSGETARGVGFCFFLGGCSGSGVCVDHRSGPARAVSGETARHEGVSFFVFFFGGCSGSGVCVDHSGHAALRRDGTRGWFLFFLGAP